MMKLGLLLLAASEGKYVEFEIDPGSNSIGERFAIVIFESFGKENETGFSIKYLNGSVGRLRFCLERQPQVFAIEDGQPTEEGLLFMTNGHVPKNRILFEGEHVIKENSAINSSSKGESKKLWKKEPRKFPFLSYCPVFCPDYDAWTIAVAHSFCK